MRLKRNSWILRYAYPGGEWKYLGSRVNLCHLFWRVVGFTFLWLVLLGFVGLLGLEAYLDPWNFLAGAVWVVGTLGMFGCCVYLGASDWRFSKTLLGQYLKARKERWCPMVEVVE